MPTWGTPPQPPQPVELLRERGLADLATAALGSAHLDDADLDDLRRQADELLRLNAGSNHIDVAFADRVTAVVERAEALARDTAALRYRASHDWLTGLPNRAALAGRWAMRSPERGPAAVLVCDLDDLKAVNDAHGHRRGDELLVIVAARITQACREHDLVTRTGGDEFVVVCPGLGRAEAQAVMERIADSVAQPMQLGPVQLQIGISIGLAMGESTEPLAGVIERADARMYAAKRRRARGVGSVGTAGPVWLRSNRVSLPRIGRDCRPPALAEP